MYSIEEKIKSIININHTGKYAIDSMSSALFSDIDIARWLVANAVKDDPHIFRMLSDNIRNDRDLAYKAVEKNGLVVEHLPDALKSDKKIALAALANNLASCEFIDSELMNDFDVGIELIKQSADRHTSMDVFEFLGARLLGEKEFALAALGYSSDIYIYLSNKLRSDYDVCYAAVTRFGWVIEHFDGKYRSNKQICLAAAESSGDSIQFMDRRMRGDYDVAMVAVTKYGDAIQYLTKDLKNNKTIVLAALDRGASFENVGEDIKNDRDVVLKAVSRNRYNFYSIPNGFRMDREVVLAAVSMCESAIKNIDPRFKFDKEIVMAAVTLDGFSICDIEDELKCDKDIALAAVKSRKGAYRFISDELKYDRDLIEAAFGSKNSADWSETALNEWVSEEADSSLKKIIDPFISPTSNISRDLTEFEQALALVREYKRYSYYTGYRELDIRWRINKEIARTAVESGMGPYELETSLLADKEFVLELMRMLGQGKCHGFGGCLAKELLCDKGFAISAVEVDGKFIEFLPDTLRQDKDIVLAAIMNNGHAINFIHDACFSDQEFVRKILFEASKQSGVFIFEWDCQGLLNNLRRCLEEEEIAGLIGFCKQAYINPTLLLDDKNSSGEYSAIKSFGSKTVMRNINDIKIVSAFDEGGKKTNRMALSRFDLLNKICNDSLFFLRGLLK